MDRVVAKPDLVLMDAALRDGHDVLYGQIMTFDVDFTLARDVQKLELGISIRDESKRWAFGTNSTLLKQVCEGVRAGNYRATYHLVAELPSGNYYAGFSFAELHPEVFELAWHDSLCEFHVHHSPNRTSIGYADLHTAISLATKRPSSDDDVVRKPVGQISLTTFIQTLQPNERTWLDVQISNESSKDWHGNRIFPINLSYRWLDLDGAVVVPDGERTALSEHGIKAGEVTRTKMAVVAPVAAGQYVLNLSLVQEHVCWFHEAGGQFSAASKEILVA